MKKQPAERRELLASPLRGITQNLKRALVCIVNGATVEQAAAMSGMQLPTLRQKLTENPTKLAIRQLRDVEREGYRDKLFQVLLAKAGVLGGVPAAEKESDQIRAAVEALGILGDSTRSAAIRQVGIMRGEYLAEKRALVGTDGAHMLSETMQDSTSAVPQLVIITERANTQPDVTIIEHRAEDDDAA